MRMLLIAAGAAFAPFAAIAAQFGDAKPLRPVSTYSIVARDAETGEMGAAVQSHWFSVGANVPHAKAGVGAVVTQSFTEVSYGPLGLAAMEKGTAAAKALADLVARDENENVRQVGFVDAKGRAAAHTGSKAIIHACDIQGDGYSVQANLMENPTVCTAMSHAYETADGDLADRLMAALEAAQGEGGDIRGMQSAAMIVVSGEKHDHPWEGRIIDLRVEDDPEPLVELRRLIVLNRAYNLMDAGDAAVTAGDMDKANELYSAAAELAPDNHEMVFWRAVTLASVGAVEDALPLFKQAFDMWPKWRELVPRLPASDILPDDPELIEAILAVK
ncbi:MAG: DUF1028 domain-containing protein [Parvularculaceae bacterium]